VVVGVGLDHREPQLVLELGQRGLGLGTLRLRHLPDLGLVVARELPGLDELRLQVAPARGERRCALQPLVLARDLDRATRIVEQRRVGERALDVRERSFDVLDERFPRRG
jgi:hypothetical protein